MISCEYVIIFDDPSDFLPYEQPMIMFKRTYLTYLIKGAMLTITEWLINSRHNLRDNKRHKWFQDIYAKKQHKPRPQIQYS